MLIMTINFQPDFTKHVVRFLTLGIETKLKHSKICLVKEATKILNDKIVNSFVLNLHILKVKNRFVQIRLELN